MINLQELASTVLWRFNVDRTMEMANTVNIIMLVVAVFTLVGLPTSADARQRRRTVHPRPRRPPPSPTTTQSSTTSPKATTKSTTNSAPTSGVPVPRWRSDSAVAWSSAWRACRGTTFRAPLVPSKGLRIEIRKWLSDRTATFFIYSMALLKSLPRQDLCGGWRPRLHLISPRSRSRGRTSSTDETNGRVAPLCDVRRPRAYL